jgi:hypothetical protein
MSISFLFTPLFSMVCVSLRTGLSWPLEKSNNLEFLDEVEWARCLHIALRSRQWYVAIKLRSIKGDICCC